MTRNKNKNARDVPSRNKKGNKTVQAPLAQSSQATNLPASMKPVKGRTDGSIVVTHREWIRSVQSPDPSFNVMDGIPINPGLRVSFPWLYALANNYESYRFRKLRYVYVPNVSASVDGAIHMHVDYDAADIDPPSSKGDFFSAHKSIRTPVWKDMAFNCDRDSLAKIANRYTRRGVHQVVDIKSYDVGILYVAVEGIPAVKADSDIGDVFVEYEVELQTPQANFQEALSASSKLLDSLTTDRANPLVGALLKGGLPISLSGNKVTFQDPGEYIMEFLTLGTNLAQLNEVNDVSDLKLTSVVNSGVAMNTTYQLKVEKPNTGISVNAAGSDTISHMFVKIAPFLYSL